MGKSLGGRLVPLVPETRGIRGQASSRLTTNMLWDKRVNSISPHPPPASEGVWYACRVPLKDVHPLVQPRPVRIGHRQRLAMDDKRTVLDRIDPRNGNYI